jgi:hypothetical protein
MPAKTEFGKLFTKNGAVDLSLSVNILDVSIES